MPMDMASGRPIQPTPLNRNRDFVAWQHFDPYQWLDTNPSFVRLDADNAWVVFTRYSVPPVPGTGSIWLVRVDATMQPVGPPMRLAESGMDPRIVRLGNRILLFYAIIERNPEGAMAGSFVALAVYAVAGDQWQIVEGFKLPKQPIQNGLAAGANAEWEKNWVPFALGDSDVGLIYSHDPWAVLTLHAEPGQQPRLSSAYTAQPIQWAYGTIRGGTPPVHYDDTHLITFFHSAQVIGSRNIYSVGACVFQAEAPYAPTLMTAEPLLMAPYHRGVQKFGWQFAGSVVFPLGCEKTEDDYRLLCGRDDGEIGSFVVTHDELSARLSVPSRGPTGTVHTYRDDGGARLPIKSLLYVPDPIPAIPELPMINFVRTIAGQGRTFVDVGSHIGFYTMGLAPGFQRVIAFEPSRFQFGWLQRNRALNAYDHVECVHSALGDTAGTATLNVLSYEGGLNSLAPEVAEGKRIIDQYVVPVEVLDDRGLDDIDLLKIDVEGFEVPVLRGAARSIAASRPVILIEVWAEAERRRDVQAMFEAMGYSLEFLFPRSPELAVCLPCERRHEYAWFI